jgi:menaquinone-dependent protoporphyrinogen IX oxidase
MGKLLARDWLRKNTAILQDKKATLFVVCANPEKEKNKRDNMMEKNVPGIVGKTCGIFFLPGRVVINQLSWFDRLVVKIGAFFEEDPAKKALMLHGFDCVKRENINDLIKSALNYSNPEKVPV